MHWRQKLSLYFFGRSMDRASSTEDFLCLAARARFYDRRFVASSYYRPTGFAWKQAFKRPRRNLAATKLNQVNLSELSALDQLSVLSLRYRIALLSAEDQNTIRELDIDQILKSSLDALDLFFDLLLLQHVVEDWANLGKVSEAILSCGFNDSDLRDLAADMLVQAIYQLITPKIFRNTVTDDDVASLKAAIVITELALGVNHPKQSHYQGVLASVTGNLEAAAELHAGASIKSGYSTQFFRAAANVVSLEEMKAFAETVSRPLPDNCWKMRHTGYSECTLLSTDQGYFFQYFEDFMESFSLLNSGALLHVHAVDFEPNLSRIVELENRFGVLINITHDLQPLRRLTPDMFKGYCAGARYMYLPQYLALYDRVIIHDIDGILETSMASVWQNRSDTIMISSLVPDDDRKGHFAFWSNIGAGAFAIAANASDLKFATALSGYLQSRFDVCRKTGGRFFFTDQVGLLLATMAFKEECNIVRMPAIFNQSSDTRGQQRRRAKKDAQEKLLKKLRQSKA